jgi:phage repressor protein C with HTH and peptisase S24 domain
VSKEQEPIHQRFEQIINLLADGVQRRFAQHIGVASGVIGDIVGQRKSKPGFDITVKILQAYPELRAEWLMRGEGEMLKSAESLKNNSVSSRPAPVKIHIEADASGNKQAPWINYKAAANYLAGYQSQERYEEVEMFSLPPEIMPGKQPYTAFTVTGESMEPTFFAEDIVLCQQIPQTQWLDLRNEILAVVVSRTHGIQLKRITVRKELRLLRCRSDNPRSIPFDISLNDEEDSQSDVLELWSFEWLLTKRNDPPSREPLARVANIENEVGDLRYLIESILDEREMARRLRERERKKNTPNGE